MDFKNIIVSILVSALVSSGALFAYHRWFEPRFVVVNLSSFIQQEKNLYLKGKITLDDFKEDMEKVSEFINRLPKNYVVLEKGAVLKGNVKEIPLPIRTQASTERRQ